MRKFAIKNPILFEVILIVLSFVMVLAVSIPLGNLYFSNEVTIALARIVVGALLFFVFLYCFKLKKQFSSLPYVLPGLLFVLWNAVNCFLTGGKINPPDTFTLIETIAPALFEEVIFREIFIYDLKENGRKDLETALISAVAFSLIHLTNAVSGNIIEILIQVGYSFVIGLFFAAIYTKSDDLLSLMIIHGLIDLSNRIFSSGAVTPIHVIILFLILLIGQALYSFWLITRK